MTAQRGATSFDLLASLALWGVVSTAVVSTLITAARSARHVTANADRRETLRAASLLTAAELRNHAGDPSTVSVSRHEVLYRARRWTGVTCRWAWAASGQLHVTIRSGPLFGVRLPTASRDSALVWLEGYPTDPGDGRWVDLFLAHVADTLCPDGRAGWVAALEPWPATAPATLVHPGAVIVGFERAALRVYRSADGAHWLGQATAGPRGWTAVQPVAGPLAASSGFAWRQDERSVLIGFRAPGSLGDSLETIVGLRSIEVLP